MNIFRKLVYEPILAGEASKDQGISIPLSTLNKFTNNIQKGQFIAIGGKPNSGKGSFMDFVYMMNTYKWWKNEPVETRPPLKFIYFNMKHSWRNKFQKWVCLYIKLQFSRVIDINTLNSGVGSLYELTPEIKNEIMTAEEFFDEMESEGVLEIINGQQTPTSILNKVRNVMLTCGSLEEKTKKYALNTDLARQFTMVFIDNVDYLLPETDGFGMMNGEALRKKITDHAIEFKNVYNITTVVVTPSKYIGKSVKENEPNYKEMGIFGSKTDLSIVLYNPYNEGNNNYLAYGVKDFVVNGKNRLRTATIVRNSNGVENMTKGLIFIGECGYFAESPRPDEEQHIFQIQQLLTELP